MSRESEFLTRHKDDLRIAAEICRDLQKQAVEVTPRERKYLVLRAVCKRLEGTCRQMGHERGDDFTWLQMGHHYHRVSETIQNLRRTGQWLKFGAMAEVFEAGSVRLDKLANTPTRTTSASATTLVLPRFLRGLGMPTTPGGIILP